MKKLWRKKPKQEIILQCAGTCGKFYNIEDMEYLSPTGLTTPGFYCLSCYIHRWDNV